MPTAEWFVTGNYLDNSGNGNTATAAGSGTTFISDPVGAGVHGTVADFNGSGYANTPVAPGVPYTVAGWIDVTTSAGGTLISQIATPVGDTLYITSAFQAVGVNALFTAKDVHGSNSGVITFNVQDSVALSQNTWYRVMVTYDGTTYTMYVNGVQVGTNTVTGNTGGNIRLAANSGLGANMIGYLHKVDVWSGTVLTSAQAALDATQN